MTCGAVWVRAGTAARRVGYSALVPRDPFEPEFPDAPALPDSSAMQATPRTPPTAPPAAPPPAPPTEPTEPSSEPADDYDLEPEPKRPRRRGTANSALPWFLAALIVLLLAATGGLVSAWVVASLRAVPVPPGAQVTPSPSAAPTELASGAPTPVTTEQPRRTPTPAPEVTQEPVPFVHVVQRGESLSYIADLYGVTVAEIVALNDIRNPDNIRVGRELLIPGYGHVPSPSPHS